MTLNTSVRVLEAMPVRPVAEFCFHLVGGKGTLERGSVDYCYDDPWMGTEWGIGNDAHLDVWYGADGPLIWKYGDLEPDTGPGPAFIEISFDTGYGFKNEHGRCNALHASYIRALGEGVLLGRRFAWENEYTGEWFEWGTRECDAMLGKWEAGSWE